MKQTLTTSQAAHLLMQDEYAKWNGGSGMSEHEIECRVERMVDRLDAMYMRGQLSETEYRAEMERITKWAEMEYAKR